MARQQEYGRIFRVAYEEATGNGLIPAVAWRHAYATALLYWFFESPERDRPDILSGYRSPERQADLLRRWDQGNRSGLISRPACRSWHTTGRALDVETDVRAFNTYEWIMTNWLSMRSGRQWGGTGHFDLPGPEKPPSICVA